MKILNENLGLTFYLVFANDISKQLGSLSQEYCFYAVTINGLNTCLINCMWKEHVCKQVLQEERKKKKIIAIKRSKTGKKKKKEAVIEKF